MKLLVRAQKLRVSILVAVLAVLAVVTSTATVTLTASTASAVPGTCNIYWTGATNNSWATSSNWSLSDGGASAGRLPTATEFVCMSTGPIRPALNYPSGTRTVAGIDMGVSSGNSLTIAAGTLNLGSVANGAFDSIVRNLTVVSGATLGGTAAVTLTGNTSATPSVGTLAGAGITTVASGATFATYGIALTGGRQLVNNGTLTHTGCSNYFTLAGGAKLDNYGTFSVDGNCGYYLYNADSNAANQVINRPGATMNFTSPAGLYYQFSGLDLRNNGAIHLMGGDLYSSPTATDTGTYQLDAGTTYYVQGGTLPVTASTVTGAGVLYVNGAAIAASGAGATLGNLTLNSGAPVTGSLSVSSLTMLSGTFSGAGTMTLPSGSTSLLDYGVLNSGYKILNQGTAQLGVIDMYAGTTYENEGVTISQTGSGRGFYDGVADGTNKVQNDAGGSMVVAMASATDAFNIGPGFTNNGQLKVTKGFVTMTTVTNQVSGVLTGPGSWQVLAGTLRFPANITTNSSSISVGATGTVQNSSGSNGLAQLAANTGTLSLARSQTINRALANSGDLSVTAGTLQPTSFTQTAGSTTLASGGALRGGASAVGAVAINGGLLTGAGTVLAPLSGTGTFQPGGAGGAMSVTGSFSPGAGSTYSVPLTGSATPGTDFGKMVVSGAATLNGTLVLASGPGYFPAVGTTFRILEAGSRSGTFSSVAGTDLSNGTYYDVSYDGTGVTLTVRSDPGATSNNASIAEGNTGTSTVSVPVTLSAASTRSVSVDYTTVDQTASAGTDYLSTSGTLTFAAGETTKSVDVTINGDTFYEPDETLLLRISNPVHTSITTADGVVTITNDDTAPTNPTVTAVSPSMVGQGASNRTLTVTGAQFTPSSTVSFARSGITLIAGSTTVVDSNTITVRVNVGAGTATGNMGVTVTSSSGSGSCAACLSISPKGLAATASPSLGQGAKLREVTITGNNFQPGAKVKITAGTVYSTSYIDSHTIEVLLTVASTKATGAYNVTVTNPDGGIGSCVGCFTVVAGPTVTSMTPSSAHRSTTTSVTITGSNYAPGAKVTGPSGVTFDGVIVTSPTTITADMVTSASAKLQSNQIVIVTNPASAGYGAGTAALLTIN